MTIFQRTRTVTSVTRGKSSREGNPSYNFTILHRDGRTIENWAKTAPNSSLGYSLPNDFPIGEDIERVVLFTYDHQIRVIKGEVRSYSNVISYDVIEVRK